MQQKERESVACYLCMQVCVCVLDGEGSRVFASRSLVEVQMLCTRLLTVMVRLVFRNHFKDVTPV